MDMGNGKHDRNGEGLLPVLGTGWDRMVMRKMGF